MNARRAVTLAILAAVAAAAIGMFAVTRTWQEETRLRPFPLPDETLTHAGTAVVPWALPAAVVGLAAAVAVIATGGVARRIVAVSLAGSGAVVAASGAFGLARVPGVWPVITMLCGTGLVVVAGWVWLRYRDWPRMSARYDRPADEPAFVVSAGDPDSLDSTTLWDALDRGDDPTR